MSFFSTTLTSLLAVSAVQAVPFSRRAAAGLNAAAQAAGLTYFGSATDNPELTDSAYMTILNNTDQFGQITPGNSMKWDTTEPSQGTFSYTKGDAIADLAEQNGQKLRCHNLVWHSQLASWVSSGNFDNDTLVEILKNHITNEVTHYKGRCLHWDVVNEPLNEDGTYQSFVFYDTIGEAYIPIAFAAAAAADPDAKLYMNEYNIEYSGAKQAAAVDIVKMVQSYGVKIDGVGIESHLIEGSVSSQDTIETAMKSFTALGVEVAVTELDIRTTTPATDAALEQQSTDYETVVNACLAVDGCVGITIWDYTDKYSWIPDTFSGYGAALPWDEDLNTKPAYDGILTALGASASANSGTSSATSTANTTAVAIPIATKTSSSVVVATPSSVVSASSSAVLTISSSAVVATSQPTTSTTTTVAGFVSKWGQCGGVNYDGSTTCASGSTCKAYNDYYSQCV